MIHWSLVTGLVGVVAARLGTARLDRRGLTRQPEVFWALGLAALLPAWLITFIGLLGSARDGRPGRSLLLSVAAALLGVIVTDARVRRLRQAGGSCQAARYWRLGVWALLPAWAIALLGHVWP